MKNIVRTLVVVFISQIGFSQNYPSEFKKHCKANDTINQLKTLKKWQSESPNDPELFISHLNYHFVCSRQEVLSLTTDQPNGESLVLKDSLKQSAGFIGSTVQYDQTELRKGLDKIDQGIALYPNRLDMRFGKVYALKQISDWTNFTTEITKAIDHSAKNNNAWTWANNERYNDNDGEKEFLLDIQGYQLQLYNTGNDELLKNMRDIANKVLEHYPNHIESLSNLSITYLLTGKYKKGIKTLLKAEKINPTDHIVLGNIAQGYKLKGNKKKAITYYEKTALYGDKKAIEYARQQVALLKQ